MIRFILRQKLQPPNMYLLILGCLIVFSESRLNEVIIQSEFTESKFSNNINYERILTTTSGRRRQYYCSGGNYKNELNKKISQECSSGKYATSKICRTITDSTLVFICVNCFPGRFVNKNASINCINCPISKYQSSSGQSSCIKNNNTCNGTDRGFIPGMTNSSCIMCSSIENIKKNNECIPCKERYYFDNTTKTCQKEPLVNEPVFWVLLVASLILVYICLSCLTSVEPKLVCIITPTMISCIVCTILFGLYIITASNAGQIILMSNLGSIMLAVLLGLIYAMCLSIKKYY